MRYSYIKIPKIDFGAKDMPDDEFAKALMDNYQVGELEKSEEMGDVIYSTSEANAYKNGWSVYVNRHAIFIKNSGIQGETSFN